MYKLIIFDLDGTLLDTSRDIHAVLNGSLKKFGLPEISLSDTVRYVGNGAKKLVERAIKDRVCDFESVYADYALNFAACDNKLTAPYDGLDKFIAECKRRDIKLAVVTNKPAKATEGVYKMHLARFDIDEVIGHSERYPLKPDPASTLAVIGEFGFDKRECLFVGDGETDVATAKNAGIDCVSALWGFRSRAQLEEAGANLFAKNYGELGEIIFH